jgi:hypothetical protein
MQHMQESRVIAMLSVHLGARRRWVVKATPLSLSSGKSRDTHYVRLRGGAGFGEHKIPLLYQGSKPETSDL